MRRTVAEKCRQDTYTPPLATALCPQCGPATAGLDTGPYVRPPLVYHVCRACGRQWNECRDCQGPAYRFWDAAAPPIA
jgi:hypothetical protein